jgi:hypothetical protein
MRGMIAFAIISGANLILFRAAGERGLQATPSARSRVPANEGSDGSTLETLRRRCVGRMWRLECGHRPIQSVRLKNARDRFPGAG